MKKQTVLALSLLLSMGATNAWPAWMSTAGAKVSSAARITGSAIATGARATGGAISAGAQKVWNAQHVQNTKDWVVGTQPAQFVAGHPVKAGIYAAGATAAVLARKQLANAARYVGRQIKGHRYIAGAVAVALAAGIGATIKFDKVPTAVDTGIRTFGTDVKNAGTFCLSNLWAGTKGASSWLNSHRKTTTAGIFTGLFFGLNRIGARAAERERQAQAAA